MLGTTLNIMTKNILQRVKWIKNLRDNDTAFLESDGVNYNKYITFLIF